MKLKRCTLIVFFAFFVFPIFAIVPLSISGDASIDINAEKVNGNFAIGKASAFVVKMGVDLNRVYNVHGEVATYASGVDFNKATFVDVSGRKGYMFGIGSSVALVGGMSLSLSGGLFIANENRSVDVYETGVYVSGRFKYLLFNPTPNYPSLFYSISVPVTVLYSGFGYHLRLGIALGLEHNYYGRRYNK